MLIIFSGEELCLIEVEYKVLICLIGNVGKVILREKIFEEIG